jgi:ATP-binding cassette, subfamily B, bacterial HlyB/CyaB
MVSGLFAFMMLSGRVAQPLVGLARLVQEYEEVNAAIGEAGAVLNRPLEIAAASGGLRPKFAGAISFQDVKQRARAKPASAKDSRGSDTSAETANGGVRQRGSAAGSSASIPLAGSGDITKAVPIPSKYDPSAS